MRRGARAPSIGVRSSRLGLPSAPHRGGALHHQRAGCFLDPWRHGDQIAEFVDGASGLELGREVAGFGGRRFMAVLSASNWNARRPSGVQNRPVFVGISVT